MATTDQVQSLYIAYFGRPADSDGLNNWTANADATLPSIANEFSKTPEYIAANAGRSATAIINGFYENLFDRQGEPAGIQEWLKIVDAAEDKQAALAQVGNSIAQAAITASPANDDTVAINAKITASNQWTTATRATTNGLLAYEGSTGVNAGIAFLDGVDDAASTPTVAQTEAAVNALIVINGSGDTLDLTIFQDIASNDGYLKQNGATIIENDPSFKLDFTNQTINATFGTFQGGDTLVDASSNDQDVLNISDNAGGAAAGTGVNATVSQIETINYVINGYQDGGNVGLLANTAATGVKNFTITGSVAANNTVTLNGAVNGGTGATSYDVSKVTGNANTSSTAITMDTAGNNTVVGGALRDVVGGGSGDTDTLNLAGGDNAFISAGAGGTGDTLTHDAASATVVASVTGTGTLTLTATAAGARADILGGTNGTINASTSTSAVTIGGVTAGGVVGTGNNNLTGGSANDTITTGNGSANFASGNGGNDTITGGNNAVAGIDTLNGGDGNDQVNAGGNNGILSGGIGNDTLTGGAAVDTLSGGTGADVLTGNAGANRLSGGTGQDDFILTQNATTDTITDFTVGETDRLVFDISALGLNAADYVAGAITFLTAAQATGLAGGGAANNIIYDTAANIAGFVNPQNEFAGGAIAIASDNGNVMYTGDGNFGGGAAVVNLATTSVAAGQNMVAGNTFLIA